MGSTAESRIKSLLDEGSFIEIGKKITARTTDFNITKAETPGDGVITGYGTVSGNLVYVYSQDESVLNGSIGEMHARKIVSLYDMAVKMGAPIIGLLDSAGIRLQEGCDALEAFGAIYHRQSLASGVVPQICAVFGKCGGGLAVSAALSDFTFMEGDKAKMFINSPNAIPGNEISKLDTSNSSFQSEKTGVVDFVGNESEIFSNMRTLISIIPLNNSDSLDVAMQTDDLNRTLDNVAGAVDDPAIILSQLADNGQFFETKRDYAKDMVTGFIKLNGVTVGVAANRTKVYDENAEVKYEFNGDLSVKGAKKASSFVNYCDAFEIPVLTLTNVNGFSASTSAEKNLSKEAARLSYAFASSTVPKINLITGNAYGSAYVVMNSKSLGADLVYAWTTSKIGMMEADMAAKIMFPDADADTLKEKTVEYDNLQGSAESAANRGYVDAIIEPAETRKHLIGAFEMLYTKREELPYKKHGAK